MNSHNVHKILNVWKYQSGPTSGLHSGIGFDKGKRVWYDSANARMRISTHGPPAKRAPGLVEGGEEPLANTPRSGRLNGTIPQ